MKNKPAYGIASVDHALRLAALLQQEGPFGVSEAADRLGVARSTAHRLLAMLVYRDFAEQDEDRRYLAGPVLRGSEPTAQLREVALPHLRALVARVDETANLVVPVGDQVRFLLTVECDRVLRVGDREGRLLPAHSTSGGRALLARLAPADVAARYPGDAALSRILRQARRQGYAVNNQETEAGVTAVGVALGEHAALSLALPTARYSKTRLPALVAELRATAGQLTALGAPATPPTRAAPQARPAPPATS